MWKVFLIISDQLQVVRNGDCGNEAVHQRKRPAGSFDVARPCSGAFCVKNQNRIVGKQFLQKPLQGSPFRSRRQTLNASLDFGDGENGKNNLSLMSNDPSPRFGVTIAFRDERCIQKIAHDQNLAGRTVSRETTGTPANLSRYSARGRRGPRTRRTNSGTPICSPFRITSARLSFVARAPDTIRSSMSFATGTASMLFDRLIQGTEYTVVCSKASPFMWLQSSPAIGAQNSGEHTRPRVLWSAPSPTTSRVEPEARRYIPCRIASVWGARASRPPRSASRRTLLSRGIGELREDFGRVETSRRGRRLGHARARVLPGMLAARVRRGLRPRIAGCGFDFSISHFFP